MKKSTAQSKKTAPPPSKKTTTKASTTTKKKVDTKKQVAKPKPAPEEKKVEEPIKELVEEEKIPEPEPVKEPVLGSSKVKYNAYNEEFKHIDGILKWEDIDEAYCFSFAFKGEYSLKLRKPNEPDIFLECIDKQFYGLEDGVAYQVEVEEDTIAESKVVKKMYVPPSKEKKKTTASELLT